MQIEEKGNESIKNNALSMFERIKKKSPDGVEFWFARELQEVLGYTKWSSFAGTIDKAKMACESVGGNKNNHFADVSKMVSVGSEAKRNIVDIALTRYACYLIAMNGDSSKTEISLAQTYFAIQTRKQEKTDELSDEEKRLLLRNRVKDANKHLGVAARRVDCTPTTGQNRLGWVDGFPPYAVVAVPMLHT